MASMDPEERRLERLRRWRTRAEPDRSLSFLPMQFKREVERPHKQLSAFVALWEELVPATLREHTRLDRLHRGVLHVEVDSSARLYELDRLLRQGLERQLIVQHAGPALRRVKLRVGTF
jgi:Dna[CI] antecedent, DciA